MITVLSERELVEEFEGQFTCLGENNKKCITFLVSIQKEITRIDKNIEEITKKTFNRLQFIYTSRSMVNLSSNLINNLAEEIHKMKCKYKHDDKCETWRIRYKDVGYFLEYKNIKNGLI